MANAVAICTKSGLLKADAGTKVNSCCPGRLKKAPVQHPYSPPAISKL